LKKNLSGFTLIEMVIFIAITAIAIFGVLSLLEFVSRNSVSMRTQTLAVEAADRCLQWFIGNRYINGYASTTCPSTAVPTFCAAPTGYTVAVNVACTDMYSSNNYKIVTVTVSASGSTVASSSLILANYT
jgi:type II secretory pathway pseudopilin PulG